MGEWIRKGEIRTQSAETAFLTPFFGLHHGGLRAGRGLSLSALPREAPSAVLCPGLGPQHRDVGLWECGQRREF